LFLFFFSFPFSIRNRFRHARNRTSACGSSFSCRRCLYSFFFSFFLPPSMKSGIAIKRYGIPQFFFFFFFFCAFFDLLFFSVTLESQLLFFSFSPRACSANLTVRAVRISLFLFFFFFSDPFYTSEFSTPLLPFFFFFFPPRRHQSRRIRAERAIGYFTHKTTQTPHKTTPTAPRHTSISFFSTFCLFFFFLFPSFLPSGGGAAPSLFFSLLKNVSVTSRRNRFAFFSPHHSCFSMSDLRPTRPEISGMTGCGRLSFLFSFFLFARQCLFFFSLFRS